MMAKSAIKDSIQQDQINFLKEGKKEDSSILRFALSFINKEEKDKQIELSDSEVVAVIKSLIKRNKDSYDQFTSANRPELAEKEKKEMDLLQSYLPEVMNENETEEIVMKAVKNLSKNLTIIIIAHRLNTLKGCDVVYKLDKGRLIDNGSFNKIKK